MQLSIQANTQKTIFVELQGEFDALGCREIRLSLEQLVEDFGDREIELNLNDVSFIDSSGIGALVFLFKRLRTQGGQVRLVNVQGQPRELITLLRVDQAMPVSWANSAA